MIALEMVKEKPPVVVVVSLACLERSIIGTRLIRVRTFRLSTWLVWTITAIDIKGWVRADYADCCKGHLK